MIIMYDCAVHIKIEKILEVWLNCMKTIFTANILLNDVSTIRILFDIVFVLSYYNLVFISAN